MPVLSAGCPTLKEATECPEAKAQAPSEEQIHTLFSAASAGLLLHLQTRNNISPCFAKRFGISTAKQGKGAVFTFLETGSSIYTQTNNSLSTECRGTARSGGRGESSCRRSRNGCGFRRRGRLENSFQRHRDFKKSGEHTVTWPTEGRSSSHTAVVPARSPPARAAGRILLLEDGKKLHLQGGGGWAPPFRTWPRSGSD